MEFKNNNNNKFSMIYVIELGGKYLSSTSPAIHLRFNFSQHLGTTQEPQNISTTKSFSLEDTFII